MDAFFQFRHANFTKVGAVGGERNWEEQLDMCWQCECLWSGSPLICLSLRKKRDLASLGGVFRGEVRIGTDRYSTSLKFGLVAKCQIYVRQEGMFLVFLNNRIKLYLSPHLELRCIILCFGFFLQGPNTIVICMVILLNIGLAILFVHFLT